MNLSEQYMKLYEMASVYSSPVFLIKVYTEPLGNPSFHLIKPNEFEVVLTLDNLKVLEVKFDKKKRKKMTFKLNSKEEKKLKNIFREIPRGDVENIWGQIVNYWNSLNPKFAIDKIKYKRKFPSS